MTDSDRPYRKSSGGKDQGGESWGTELVLGVQGRVGGDSATIRDRSVTSRNSSPRTSASTCLYGRGTQTLLVVSRRSDSAYVARHRHVRRDGRRGDGE